MGRARLGLLAVLVGLGLLGTAAARETDVLVYHLDAKPDSLDPAKCNTQRCHRVNWIIYERLMDLSKDGSTLVPGLAASWTVSPDGLTYTFHLRKGVVFHDGAPFNATAVKVNLERNYLKGSEFYSAEPPNARETQLAGLIREIRVIDDFTLSVSLSEPAVDLLYLVPLASPKALQEMKKHNKKLVPAGTGPFRFEGWQGNEVRLVANQNYWGGRPKLRGISFRIIPNSDDATRAFLAGDIDFLPEVEPVWRPKVRDNPTTKLVPVTPVPSLFYMAFRFDRMPFNDVRVRQAFTKAINVEAAIKKLLEDVAVPAFGPIPPGAELYDPERAKSQYDPDAARRLLKEAGYPHGRRVSLVYNGAWEYLKQLTEAIRTDLSKVGVTVDLVPVSGYTELLQSVRGEKGDLFIYQWFFPLASPRAWLRPHFFSKSRDNLSRYRNDAVDSLFERAKLATDAAARLDLYRQARDTIMDDYPMVFLFHFQRVSAYGSRVTGLDLNNQAWPVDRFLGTDVR